MVGFGWIFLEFVMLYNIHDWFQILILICKTIFSRYVLCTYNMLKIILTNTYYKCIKASWVFYRVIQTSSNV